MLTFVVLAMLFGPWVFLALIIAYGAWSWWHMSEWDRDVYRRLARMPHEESEWGRLLRRGY